MNKGILSAVVLLLALTSVGASVGPVLETPTIGIEFGTRDEGFGLRRIVNRVAGGVAFAEHESAEADLWELRTVAYTNALPAVLGSVWRHSTDCKRAVVAVNVSPDVQVVRFLRPGGKGEVETLRLDPQDVSIREFDERDK